MNGDTDYSHLKIEDVEHEVAFTKRDLSDDEKQIFVKLYNWNFVHPDTPYYLNGQSIQLGR